MSKIARIMQQATAGAAGAGLDIDEAFSTYLYDGNGSSQTITNGIDLSGEGGLLWTKARNVAFGHNLFDTERGFGTTYAYRIFTNETNAQSELTDGVSSFNSNGFSVGNSSIVNGSSYNYASWTFRKAPKFFDVVTWTGNGVNGRTISHNLGSVPGMIIVKSYGTTEGWIVYHRGMDASSPEDYAMFLNLTNARATETYWNNTAPTSTGFTVSNNVKLNGGSGQTYVAYVFAHNNSDGEFGPDADQDVIKCGSVNANSTFTLPWQPQWILSKDVNRSGDWHIIDSMRGFTASSNYDKYLEANNSNAEQQAGWFDIDGNTLKNRSGGNIIYMAIRRGPLAEPTSATDVFQPVVSNVPNPNMVSTNLSYIDMAISKKEAGGQSYVQTRLTGDAFFKANGTDAETTGTSLIEFDHNNKMRAYFDTYGSDHINYFWKRAPGFFDVVAYTGNSVAGRNINHNLGVAPEMMWVKRRSDANNCTVYHKGLDATAPEDYGIYLDDSAQRADSVNFWNDTAPTSSVFTVGTASKTNANTATYIAYLFATLAGVSKVGSFSHTVNTATNVDCGFTSGARFVLAKQSDGSGNWWVWDTERGIVAGNDNRLALNTTGAENTNNDDIDPYSAGFTWAATWSTGTYIFYAIA